MNHPSSCTESRRHPLSGLYAITDIRHTDPEQLATAAEQALRGGARLIQYRDKTGEQARRLNCAQRLRVLTRRYQALLIINDDSQLAKHSRADGVHLGRDDSGIAEARALLGNDAIIGISCYNRFELAQQAATAGADYVAFGRFFPSRTKPGAAQADATLLQRAQQELDIPVVAIGGITADNGQTLIEAGAHMLAVVGDIFAQADIEAAAQAYQKLFANDHKTSSPQETPP